MTGRDYALLAMALLFFGAACWLAVALSEARSETERLRAERDGLQLDLDNERADHARSLTESTHRWGKTCGEMLQEFARMQAERNDAHTVLDFVLSHHDVATTLDMVKVVPLHPKARAR